MTATSPAPRLSLWAQLWGTTYEKIHTLGTGSLAVSLVAYLAVRPLSKPEAAVVFLSFGLGCALIGWATLCNSWTRWRHGEDQLILLKRRDPNAKRDHVELHLLGRCWSWEGPLAHIDIGTFSFKPIADMPPSRNGNLLSRGYRMFRAVYWAACSSLQFQATFGLGAFAYGLWLLAKVHAYLLSAA